MTAQLCNAPHRDNPPRALGGLRLCPGHHGALEDALTGPSAADDPTLDAIWGVRTWWGIAGYENRTDAHRALDEARVRYRADQRKEPEHRTWRLPPKLFVGDGSAWTEPRNWRPGGITRDWSALGHRAKSHRTGDPAPYVIRSAENPLPIDERLAEVRHHIPSVLTSWATLHARELDVAGPQFGASVHQLAAFLARYVDWSAAQEWAGDYVRELGELRARARTLIDLPRPPRAEVGPCPEYQDGQRCVGVLRSTVREERDPRPSSIDCDRCGATWDSTQWMRLGQRVEAVARRAA